MALPLSREATSSARTLLIARLERLLVIIAAVKIRCKDTLLLNAVDHVRFLANSLSEQRIKLNQSLTVWSRLLCQVVVPVVQNLPLRVLFKRIRKFSRGIIVSPQSSRFVS